MFGILRGWGVLFLLVLASIPVCSQLVIDPGIFFEVDGVNYTFVSQTSVAGLELYPFFGGSDRAIKITPSTAYVEVEIHIWSDDVIFFNLKPSEYLGTMTRFKDLNSVSDYYSFRNESFIGSFVSNSSGGGKFNTGYHSVWKGWNFTLTPPIVTTTTSTTSTTSSTLGTTTTSLFNGTYVVPEDFWLKNIYEVLSAILLGSSENEGICQLVVDNETWFGSPEITRTSYISEYDYDEFLNTGTYYWKVRCYYRGRWSMWSNTLEINHTDISKGLFFDWSVIS